MNICLTGGSGRLGTELQGLRRYTYAPTSREMEVSDYDSVMEYLAPRGIDLIVHAAAYTAVEKAEIEKERCYAVNVTGTKNIAEAGIPVLYISTEYVFDGEHGGYKEDDVPNPKNYYALTKVLGEHVLNPWSKTIRLVFKPRPWPFEGAFDDQFTGGDYVDLMAKEVDKVITAYERVTKLPRILHLGTGRKSVYDLAKQTRDVKAISRFGVSAKLPRDTSLDTSLWEKIKKENGLEA